MHFANKSIMLRRIGWLLFWSLAAISLLVVLLFLWTAVSTLTAISNGGSGGVWLFGTAGHSLAAAIVYLAVVVRVIIKRRTRGADGVGT